ncbi:MAG: UDP-N-acetylmuramoyl-tripeptide--D-alanyl-D-alanine ligase [Candidatus Doudnabacteria bacterium]|nr:UDP-N-acetylmuramoyl-tripeptide--D-alanyl-D-alanine ligase [Candidatus Doudnabacteria bacterium]
MSNLFKAIKYQLYLLQLESYELGRFWKLLFKKGLLPKGGQRKQLVWTGKAVLIFGLAEIIVLGLSIGLAHALFLNVLENTVAAAIVGLAAFYILQFLGFFFLPLSVIILAPVDWIIKNIIIWRAKLKITKLQNLKIIGVAGSYGKTTMKEVLKEVLGARFQVLATPESVNTPVGIARWILKTLKNDTEILIVEMGEHYKGDVEEICNFAKPDVAVVTGINEAHLERMKTLSNITDTIFEIVSKAAPRALVVLNGDDKNVVKHYKEYVWPDHRIERFKIEDLRLKKFDTEKLCWEGEIEKLGKLEINLLGEYALGDVSAAITIAQNFGMSNEEILKGVAKIKPVEHRLQPIKSAGGVLVIDDAYNGNPAGVAEAIKVLSRFQNRRKLFITPGLVETGKAASEIHKRIGEQLAEVADVVILIKNSVTPFILEGINGSIKNQELRIMDKKPEVIIFDSATEAHASLSKILKPNDVIVFQNDWGDQYI